MTDFDPAQHRMVSEQRWFEDFVLGERFVIPSRTQTSAVFAAFQTASGDTHPIHYDVEYCRSRGMPDLLAHGFQTLVHTAPGAGLFPYVVEESLVGFLEQSSRFLKPVYAGDTLYPALEVIDQIGYRSLLLGFPFMTLGLLTGSVLAVSTYGSVNFLDPKILLSLLMWAVYMVMVFTRWNSGWRGRRAAFLATFAFVAAIVAWIANYFSAMHRFAAS